MQLKLSNEEIGFRDEVRAFLAEQLDPEVSNLIRYGYLVGKSIQDNWTRILNKQGWAAPNWPVENGGTGWSMVGRHIFDVEMRGHHAPELEGFGFSMVGPAIIKYGSQAQKERYLPKIMNADMSWCQGYSEPGAGSDLASVRTRAVSDGDDYLVTGSKIWTSAAEHADHIFVLVRTDPDVKKQQGITFLLIAMNQPGITVEPLIAFNGKRLWNQVFFDQVRVSKSNKLGEENQGWTVAKNLLGNERVLVSRVSENKRIFSNIRHVLACESKKNTAIVEDFRHRLAELEIRLQALEMTALRLLSQFDQGATVGAEPSMLKLKGSQLVQDMDCLLFDLTGYYGLPLDSRMRETGGVPVGPIYADMAASGMFHHRGYTIAGGSSEIQHNIIAQQVLGL